MNALAYLLIGPVAGLSADLTVTVTASDRSEARLRSIPVAAGAPVTPLTQRKTAIDLSTTPTVGLSFALPEAELTLGYAVGISKVDLDLDLPVLVMHSGRAAIAWWTRSLRLTLSEDGSYGRTTYLGFAPEPQLAPPSPMAPPPTITYVPIRQEMTLGALRTTLAAGYEIDARWNSSASVSYGFGGGVDADSERLVPRYRATGGDVGLIYAFSATDNLASRVATTHTSVSRTGGNFLTVAATEAWGHRFSDQTQSTLSGGLTYMRGRGSRDYTYGMALLPNAGAGITHTIPIEGGSTVGLTASTALGTGYNSFRGVVQYAASASAGAVWTVTPFALTATVAGGQSIPVLPDDPPVSRVLSAAIGASYAPFELVSFEVGERTSWQFVENPPPESGQPQLPSYPPQWVVYAAVNLRAPPLRF